LPLIIQIPFFTQKIKWTIKQLSGKNAKIINIFICTKVVLLPKLLLTLLAPLLYAGVMHTGSHKL